MSKNSKPQEQAVIELASEKIILWQDHSHPNGYRPTLKMVKYRDGSIGLELDVFGRVSIQPYTKAECGHE